MAAKKTQVIVRNLLPLPGLYRFGSRKDPYHMSLKRRGEPGDVTAVPTDISEHPDFSRGLGKYYELITAAEGRSLEYAPQGPAERHIRRERGLLRTHEVATIERVDTQNPGLESEEFVERSHVGKRYPDLPDGATIRDEIGPRKVQTHGSRALNKFDS